MKTYRRIVRRRLEAALKLRVVVPEPDAPIEGVPSEVIDLATGPFEARFPGLAAISRMRKPR